MSRSISKNEIAKPVREYDGHPFVSILIPCFNEERFIEKCLRSVVETNYPKDRLEILIIDGMSTDKTRDIVSELTQEFPFIRLVDNEKRIKPIALNLGISVARGDALMRMDAHAYYPPEYIPGLVRYLMTYDCVNVGGVRRNLSPSDNLQAKVLASLLTHKFGVGDAKHYTGSTDPIYTDIVFLFCARKELFEELGGFKEPLIRGQDREFNLRVGASGKKMLLAPDITCDYYARDKLGSFFDWAFVSGATPFRINRYTQVNTISYRNLVPPAFVLSVAIALLLLFTFPLLGMLALAAIFIPYGAIALIASFQVAQAQKDWRMLPLMPLAFFSWHFTYGIGAIYAFFESLFAKDGI